MLAAGNARFVADERAHPNQDVHFSGNRIALQQNPFAIFFGCADFGWRPRSSSTRASATSLVVRTAGHVVDLSVLGSLEFGVAVLNCPLIVVLRPRLVRGRHGCERGGPHGRGSGRLPLGHRRARDPERAGGFARRPLALPRRRSRGSTWSAPAPSSPSVRRSWWTACAPPPTAGRHDLAHGEARVLRVLGDVGVTA